MAEKHLWQAVVNTAFLDATMEVGPRPPMGKDRSNWNERDRAQKGAHKWLTRNSDDFREVCDLAGYDPDAIRGYYSAGRFDRAAFKKADKRYDFRRAPGW